MGSIVITVITALFVNDTGCHFLCEGVTLNSEKLQIFSCTLTKDNETIYDESTAMDAVDSTYN